MPNTADSITTLFNVLQSGLVVSGNADIIVTKAITSGDTLSLLKTSGKSEIISLYQGRTDAMPLTGGFYVEMADYVIVEVSIRKNTSLSGSVEPYLRTRLNDLVITVASGFPDPSFTSGSNPTRPILVGMEIPQPHELAAKGKATYRTRYLQ